MLIAARHIYQKAGFKLTRTERHQKLGLAGGERALGFGSVAFHFPERHAVAPLRLGPSQVLVQPRHDLDEIARAGNDSRAGAPESRPRHPGRRRASPAGRKCKSHRRRRPWRATGWPRCRFWGSSPPGTAPKSASIFFSNSGSIASGVTSRPVKPVPPVVMITSIAGSAIHCLTRRADRLDIVRHDAALGDHVAGGNDALHQDRARLVVLEIAGVGHGQHRDLERHELSLSSIPGIGQTSTQSGVRNNNTPRVCLPTAYRTPRPCPV